MIFFFRLHLISSGLLTRLHTSNYTRVHYDTGSEALAVKVNLSTKIYVRVKQKQYNMDMLDLLKVAAAEHYTHPAAAPHRTLKGLDLDINPDHPPKSYRDAVSSKDS